MRALVVVAALTMAISASVHSAHAAEPSAADKATALDLLRDGMKLRDAGDLDGALAKLKAAYALAPTPITGYELARTYDAGKHLVDALAIALEVGRLPVGATESAAAKKARAQAAKLAADVRPRIPSIAVKLAGVPAGAHPTVTIDGAPIAAAAIAEPYKVDPGTHLVAAWIDDGGQRSVAVDVDEGEAKEVPLAVEAPAPKAIAIAPKPPESHPEASSSKVHPLVYVGFGVAGAGLVVGSISGLVALSKTSTVKNECYVKDCPPGTQGDIDGAKTMGTISTLAWIGAGIGAGVGIVGLVLSSSHDEPKPSATASFDVWIGPTSAGLRGAF